MTELAHHTGRPEWQRSEGQFLYSELAEAVFPVLAELIGDESFAAAHERLEKRSFRTPQAPWLIPAIAAEAIDKVNYETPDYQAVIAKGSKATSLALHQRYTFQGNPAEVFEEGLSTAAHFPISTLFAIDLAHTKLYRGRRGRHLIGDEGDIMRLLGTVEFSEFLHNMALARNGYWPGPMSDRSQLVLRPDGGRTQEFLTHFVHREPKSALGLGLDMKPQLAELRRVNRASLDPPMQETQKHGGRSAELSRAASSGCPVAHHAPSFHSEAARRHRIRLLRAFKIPRETLETPRPKTGIQLGLEAYIAVLKKAMAYASGQTPK